MEGGGAREEVRRHLDCHGGDGLLVFLCLQRLLVIVRGEAAHKLVRPRREEVAAGQQHKWDQWQCAVRVCTRGDQEWDMCASMQV